VARDPDGPPGSGIFDRLETLGDRRRAVGICVSVAAALTITQIALPSPVVQAPIPAQLGAGGVVGHTPVIATTVALTPVLWLIACTAIIVSYARKPAPSRRSDRWPGPHRERTRSRASLRPRRMVSAATSIAGATMETALESSSAASAPSHNRR
jgi:hypothetical protein